MISVVVPAYNRRETLATTLDALLAQTHADWEAIVVDDGSTDATAELAESYGRRDARIRVHRQPNGGVSRARNAGIALVERPWTFFLDADDWILPETFERLLAAAAAGEDVDAVYGGYVRVDDAGRELQRQLPELEPDLFPLFARTCAISIHACLVRTELVRAAGGFDESLVTCEDWDLWQRIARIGARFAAIPDYFAFYRMRVGSASGAGRRMLDDGLLVIERGHGEDPRVADRAPAGRQSLSRAARDVARTYFACYAAGLEIAAGRDARDMIDALGEGISGDVDPHGVAETLFHAIPVGRATDASEWASFPAEVHHCCQLFVEALGERLGDHWLAFVARDALDRLVLAATRDERPRRAGRWYLVDLDLDGPPPQDLQLDPGVERLLCTVRLGEQRLGDFEVPVVDGWVPARVLADAIVAERAWDVLRAFLERHVHPRLEIELAGNAARVLREGRTLFDGPLAAAATLPEALHDQIGWTVFLQELWDAPSWSDGDFYDGGRAVASDAGRLRPVDGALVEVDIARPLPALDVAGRDTVDVAVRVAGAPLTVVECEVRGGTVSAQQLRRDVLIQTGYELCRAVMREAVVLAPADAAGSLRARLVRTHAADRPGAPAGVTSVGRAAGPDGTAVSRWVVLPAAAAQERLALARRDGDPIAGPEADGVARLLWAPVVLERGEARGELSDDSLLRSREFEQIFGARRDPWRYDSRYEQEKYAQTLALLPAERAERALELGCAEGTFTHLLAARVGALTAADISRVALARAGARCADRHNVAFVQMDAFAGEIGGPYDLIVCSEMLYYAAGPGELERTARTLAAALTADGHLLTAHAHVVADDPSAPGFDWDVPFGAAAIERTLRGTDLLELRRELRTPAYRVQLYARRRARWRRPRVKRVVGEAEAMAPEQASRFLPHGGAVRREPPAAPAPASSRLPILMYHRVAPDGAEATGRWRVHPDDFEAHLRHLRDEGYRAVTFEQWRVASDRRLPLPARSVLLTFDDGYADFADYAMPLLERYGLQATMFIVTDLVGASNVWDEELGEALPLLDWPALVALRARGLELGSHSSLHHPLVTLSAAELTRDLCRSRMRFHEHLGETVRSVCYPYGLHDAGVRAIAGACGFRYGVTTNEWQAALGDDLLGLPRLEVRGTTTLPEFVALLHG